MTTPGALREVMNMTPRVWPFRPEDAVDQLTMHFSSSPNGACYWAVRLAHGRYALARARMDEAGDWHASVTTYPSKEVMLRHVDDFVKANGDFAEDAKWIALGIAGAQPTEQEAVTEAVLAPEEIPF